MHVVGWDGVDKKEIQSEIEQDDDASSDEQGKRKVLFRILYLRPDVSGCVPPTVGKHDPHQREPDDLPPSEIKTEVSSLRKMIETAASEGKSDKDQADD